MCTRQESKGRVTRREVLGLGSLLQATPRSGCLWASAPISAGNADISISTGLAPHPASARTESERPETGSRSRPYGAGRRPHPGRGPSAAPPHPRVPADRTEPRSRRSLPPVGCAGPDRRPRRAPPCRAVPRVPPGAGRGRSGLPCCLPPRRGRAPRSPPG